MECALCGAAALSVCANCAGAAYCGKQHQREHWAEHKQHCFPCTVLRNDTLGRFLSTTRPVPAGALLVKEWPLVVGPRAASRPVCLGCHCVLRAPGGRGARAARAANKQYECAACGAPVCDSQCAALAAHARWECSALATLSPAAGSVLAHSEVVLPLRCLLGVRSATPDWRSFLELEAHLDKRRASPIWSELQNNVVEVLRSVGVLAPDGSEDELVQRICAILDVNSFEVRGPAAVVGEGEAAAGEQLRAVFPRAAMMAHSCLPNCQLAVDDQLQLTVRASCALPRAAPILYNYCELLETTAQRQDYLKKGKYFECSCARCADPTECGSQLSSLWCPRCKGGLLVPPATSPASFPIPSAPALTSLTETEPKVTESKAAESKAAEPKVTESKAVESKAAEPKVTESKAVESKAAEPKVTESKVTESKAAESKVTESKVAEPKAVEPKAVEPKALEPKAAEPKAMEPGDGAAAGLSSRPVRALPAAVSPLPTSCRPRPPGPSGPPGSPGTPDRWRCTRCGAAVSSRAARSALLRCAEAWEAARSGEDGDGVDVRRLEALLARLSGTLPPRHALQLSAKQVLVALYRDSTLAARRPKPHALARVRALCQEILDVLELLLPGHLSRLKGIALHELHVAVALGGGPGDLRGAHALLTSSIQHLQLEPADSPEGRLHRLALQELAAIEEGMRQDLVEEVGRPQLAEKGRRRGRRRR